FVVGVLALGVGGLLTWADRRGGAMMQDRIGPNRAVLWLPRPLAQALVVASALLVAAGMVAWAVASRSLDGPPRTARAFGFAHAAVLVVWVTGALIARFVARRGVRSSFDAFIAWIGGARRILAAGLIAHVAVALPGLTLRGTATGHLLREFAFGGAPFVFALVVVFAAAYAAFVLQPRRRVGLRLAGLLHPAADGLKTLFKEDFVPPNADRFLHGLAPFVSFFPALVLLAVVPFGDTLCLAPGAGGELDWTSLLSPERAVPPDGVCALGAVRLQAVDLNVGLLYVFALGGTAIVGAALAGWSSDNKYSLLGGLRAASQMVSYEVTLGLTLVGALMVYGTIRFDEMVAWQARNTWGIFAQPLGAVLFFTAAIAESKRIPFDLPEGESEIVAGYHTEYSGMKFTMFYFSEYVAVVTVAALMTTVFFGGWHVPFLDRDGVRIAIGDTVVARQALSHVVVVGLGVAAFLAKTALLCGLQLAIRWTLPRFRYDHLMRLGWRILLPASLLNILGTGLLILAIQQAGPHLAGALAIAADLSMALVAVATIGSLLALVSFWMEPARHAAMPATSAVRAARARGGTRSARMGA
ncbi:MAG TPA: NADH-quinone oxidoreductase subunit H, partial [Polyangiaceae bacterium]|nr:NADH-quinone oxidoreductase subunit H [Polyangiaceae bacterium]